MARNRFDQDEELVQEFNWSQYKRVGQYVTPYKKSIFKVLFEIGRAHV